MRRVLFFFLLVGSLWATDKTKVVGNLKMYNINTLKQSGDISTADATSLTVGGQLGITSADWQGLYIHANLMTTNGLMLMDDPSRVDGSNLGNDIAAASGNDADKRTSFSMLAESYIGYKRKGYELKLGRQKFDSPLAAQKEVRLLPSTFSGAVTSYSYENFTLGLAYLDRFKQRTSNSFYNILEHALGAQTLTNTGKSKGEMIVSQFSVGKKFSFYNYHLDDFMNSSYAEFKDTFGGLDFAIQAIHQTSVGYFNTAIKNGTALDSSSTAINESEGLKATAFGLKLSKKVKSHSFFIASTYSLDNENAYSNIIAPYDGTPLFTDTITGNDLFQSLYGKALRADSGYKAGVFALKGAYSYALNKKVKMTVATARYDNQSEATQTDLNAVLSYKMQGWSLAAKGIWVFDNNQVAGDKLQQYRLIANYPF